MGEKTKNILITIGYFFIVIAFFGSAGIWISIMSDNYSIDKISNETYNSLASNILTYGLGILIVAVIDRIIFLLFKTSQYSNNVLEFLCILIFVIGTSALVFLVLKNLKILKYNTAIEYAIIISLLSWIAWFYVKLQGSKNNNFSPLGGII